MGNYPDLMYKHSIHGCFNPFDSLAGFPHSCVRRLLSCVCVNRVVGDGATALTWRDVGVVLGSGSKTEAAEVVKKEGNEEQCHITAARDT